MIILALNLYNHFTSTDYLRTEKDISNYSKNRRSALFGSPTRVKKKTNLRDFAPAKANNLVANERLISNDFLSYASFNKETLIHCCW